MTKGFKLPPGAHCTKHKGKKMATCSWGKKGGKHGKHNVGKLKRTRGARMRMAKKRAAKMPGGRGPVAKRPAGRKILKH